MGRQDTGELGTNAGDTVRSGIHWQTQDRKGFIWEVVLDTEQGGGN